LNSKILHLRFVLKTNKHNGIRNQVTLSEDRPLHNTMRVTNFFKMRLIVKRLSRRQKKTLRKPCITKNIIKLIQKTKQRRIYKIHYLKGDSEQKAEFRKLSNKYGGP